MVHEPVHIVHLFTVHSVNFFEFQIIVIYLLINKQIEHLFGVSYRLELICLYNLHNLPKINSKTLRRRKI
jgi:hypothetical protein